MDMMFVPTILFLVIVAPIWIVMHYQSKNKAGTGLADEDRLVIDDMLKTADRLTDRIDALERILDADQPDWRQSKYD